MSTKPIIATNHKLNTDTLIDELDKRTLIRFGENKSAEYNEEGVGDPRLALFFQLVHDVDDDKLYDYVRKIIVLCIETKNLTVIIDLFVIIFQTRDIRGGKGRRNLFYHLILITYEFFPQIIIDLLFLIPNYGYYKDFFNILEMAYTRDVTEHRYKLLIDKIYELVINQIRLDAGEYENAIKESRKPMISLLAKYIPKEKKHFDRKYSFVEKISDLMYPGVDKKSGNRKRTYRLQISLLNKALNVVEIKMSARKFSEIVFSQITSKNALKYKKAFLNVNIENGMQRSIEDDRIEARKNFIESILANKIKGGSLEIYDIVKSIIDYLNIFFLYGRKKSDDGDDYDDDYDNADAIKPKIGDIELKLFETMWNDMRTSLVKRINERTKEQTRTRTLFKMDNLIPVADVSGSMTGMPMLVAIGLSILVSELGTTIKDRVMTFSQNPTWINLENLDIVSKIQKVMNAEWGMNTNFEKVYKLLIDVIKTKKLKQRDIPNIIVFSDMQFDQASGRDNIWETHYEKIVKEFQQVGMLIEGVPYDPPMIIFWNLRGDTKGFPVMKNTSNVKMLSGFSPNLLEYVLDGNVSENINTTDTTNTINSVSAKSETPYITMRRILDDDRYELVREIVKAYVHSHKN